MQLHHIPCPLRYRTWLHPVVCAVLLGCSPADIALEVRASFQDGEPLAGLEIVALPFDRDRIRDSLATVSSIERPSFPELEAELAAYRVPDLTGLEEFTLPWQAINDSVMHLADSLYDAGSDSSPQYAAAYARLGEQYRRLARAAANRDDALRERIGDDRQLATRAAAAADSLRVWEAEAFAQFPVLADSALRRTGLEPVQTVTDTDGNASLTLTTGRWWLVAVRMDPNNPFGEYYWNIGIVVRRWWGSRVIMMDSSNGLARWRH